MWGRAATHQNKLFAEGKIFESLVPELSKIQCPVLCLKGKYDLVASDEQVKAFKKNVKNGKVIVFKNSNYFPRTEKSEKYAEVVTKFLIK